MLAIYIIGRQVIWGSGEVIDLNGLLYVFEISNPMVSCEKH